ncbi:MAG: hypothetical protein NDI88_07525 [Lysobacter sp.]|nr:hypothetical protein [Lysobacter sp.]
MSDNDSLHDSDAHDAHRVMERRALRNVRGLVDRLQADEEASDRSQRRLVVVLAVIVIAFGAFVLATVNWTPGDGRTIPVPPVTKAPGR